MSRRDMVLDVTLEEAEDSVQPEDVFDPELEADIQRAEAFVTDEILPMIDDYEDAHPVLNWSVDYDLFIVLARRLIAASWSREQLALDVLEYGLHEAAVAETGAGVQ